MASHYLCLTIIKILFEYNIFIPKILSYFGWHTFESKSQNCSTSGVSSRTSSPIPSSSCSVKKAPLQSASFSSEETQSPVTRGTTVGKLVTVLQKQPCNETSTAITTSPTLLSESSGEATSPPKSLLDPQTMLPRTNKNQFIVAATIHKVDA